MSSLLKILDFFLNNPLFSETYFPTSISKPTEMKNDFFVLKNSIVNKKK